MRYGYCAAGFSAALTEDGVLAMGIPGTAVWKGRKQIVTEVLFGISAPAVPTLDLAVVSSGRV